MMKWIKIETGIFENRKMQYLKSQENGERLCLIWIMLLTLAGKCGIDGKLEVVEGVPYTPEMIASAIGYSRNVTVTALELFRQISMVKKVENTYQICGWEEYQSVGAMERSKALNRERQRRYRAKNKEEATLEKNNACLRDSNVTVTHQNKNKNKNIKEEPKGSKKKSAQNFSAEISEILAYLNSKTGKRFKPTTDSHVRLIGARLKDGYSVADCKKVIDIKCAEWLKDPKMAKYLCPSTLFAASHFDDYLNQETATPSGEYNPEWGF